MRNVIKYTMLHFHIASYENPNGKGNYGNEDVDGFLDLKIGDTISYGEYTFKVISYDYGFTRSETDDQCWMVKHINFNIIN